MKHLLCRLLGVLLLGCFFGAATAASVIYSYDEAGRLKAATYDDGTTVTYGLDAAGNRKAVTTVTPSPGAIQWNAATYAGSEGGAVVSVVATRTGGTTGAVSATYSLTGTAANGTDYTVSGALSWAAGDAANKNLAVSIVDDLLNDPNETVVLTLTAPTGGATLGSPSSTALTITDNDPPGTLQLVSTAYSITETGGSLTVTLTRVGGIGGAASISYATANGTAVAGPGGDYTAASGTLSWAAGDGAAKIFGVPVNTDALAEGNETFTVNLSGATGATAGTPVSATVTITDVDVTPPIAPGNPTFTAIAATSATANWTAATDAFGVTAYEYRLNGAASWTALGNVLSVNLTGLTGSTLYAFDVRARDLAGNIGAFASGSFTTAAAADTTPPSVPSSLAGSAPASGTINLSWTVSTDTGGSGLASYRVERCTGSGCTAFAEIGSSPAGVLTYVDNTVSGTTTYVYRVRARDGANNNSGYSNSAQVVTPDTIAPTDPTALTGTAPNSTNVNLSWTASADTGGSGLATYRVERCTGAGCSSFVELANPPTTTSYGDGSVAGTTTYVYRVRARDAAGNNSNYSNVFQISTPDTIAPTVPIGLTATGVSPSQVNLAWSPSTDTGGSGLAAYDVFRNGTYIFSIAATTASDTGLAANTTYSYSVRAYDNANNSSALSTAVNGTTLPPIPGTVSWDGTTSCVGAVGSPCAAIAFSPDTPSAFVSWSAASGSPTSYQLEVMVEGISGFGQVYQGAALNFTLSNMINGFPYDFRVRACNASGCGPWSAINQWIGVII